MNGNLVLKCVGVFVAGGLLLVGSASAQTTGTVKVSNAIEGNPIPGLSAARCGTNIVVGFADAEGVPAGSTTAGPGFAVSKDGGKTFSDLGVLSDPSLGFGGGDSAVIGCASSSLFYYTTRSVIQPQDGPCAIACTQIMVSPSVNGGMSWGAAAAASTATFDIYNLQSPAMAIDPTNPKRIYVAYINHNFAPPNDYPGCGGGGDEYILEVVTSTDGGNTWNGRSPNSPGGTGSPNLQPDHTCFSYTDFGPQHTGSLAAPSVVVSPTGTLYVAYEFVAEGINGPPAPNEIRFTRSVDGGNTFSAPITVSRYAINNALPEIAVDRTNSPHRGQIFLTWSGAPAGTYTSVLESDSLNAGLSFSFPRPINGTPGAGLGRFQANPAIAVDNDGQVQICYYNTPTNTPTSTSVYSYNCATSFNHAATWQLQRVANSAPVGYDAVTSDFLQHHDGFFNAFELQTNGVSHVAGQFSDIN
jgi:hypothetical protein